MENEDKQQGDGSNHIDSEYRDRYMLPYFETYLTMLLQQTSEGRSLASLPTVCPTALTAVLLCHGLLRNDHVLSDNRVLSREKRDTGRANGVCQTRIQVCRGPPHSRVNPVRSLKEIDTQSNRDFLFIFVLASNIPRHPQQLSIGGDAYLFLFRHVPRAKCITIFSSEKSLRQHISKL